MVTLTRDLFCSIIKKTFKTDHCRIRVLDKEMDIAGEWTEIDFIGGLEERTGVKFPL